METIRAALYRPRAVLPRQKWHANTDQLPLCSPNGGDPISEGDSSPGRPGATPVSVSPTANSNQASLGQAEEMINNVDGGDTTDLDEKLVSVKLDESVEEELSPAQNQDKLKRPVVPGSNSQPEALNGQYVEMRESPLGGLGLFATTELRLGQVILMEKAIFHADESKLYDEVDKLEPGVRAAFNCLYAHLPRPGFDRTAAIFRTNNFKVDNERGIFLLAARFNHACKPKANVAYRYDKECDSLVVTVCQDVIPAGTELTISYSENPEALYNGWGIRCNCGGCEPLTDDKIASIDGY